MNCGFFSDPDQNPDLPPFLMTGVVEFAVAMRRPPGWTPGPPRQWTKGDLGILFQMNEDYFQEIYENNLGLRGIKMEVDEETNTPFGRLIFTPGWWPKKLHLPEFPSQSGVAVMVMPLPNTPEGP